MKKQLKTVSEQEILDRLDIPDWRHMSKNKIIEFASSLPRMDPEVAKNALAQFPKFSQMGTEIVNCMEDSLNNICALDADISEKTQQSLMSSIHILEKQLNRRFMSSREREKIIDGILELNKNLIDLENGRRHFWSGNFRAFVAGAVSIVGVGATLLGINIKKL